MRKDLPIGPAIARRHLPEERNFAFEFMICVLVRPDAGAIDDRVGIDVGRSVPVGWARRYVRVALR